MAVEIALGNIMPLLATHIFAFLMGAVMMAILQAVKEDEDE